MRYWMAAYGEEVDSAKAHVGPAAEGIFRIGFDADSLEDAERILNEVNNAHMLDGSTMRWRLTDAPEPKKIRVVRLRGGDDA